MEGEKAMDNGYGSAFGALLIPFYSVIQNLCLYASAIVAGMFLIIAGLRLSGMQAHLFTMIILITGKMTFA